MTLADLGGNYTAAVIQHLLRGEVHPFIVALENALGKVHYSEMCYDTRANTCRGRSGGPEQVGSHTHKRSKNTRKKKGAKPAFVCGTCEDFLVYLRLRTASELGGAASS